MKIKVSELEGAALDRAVAKCLGHRVAEDYGVYIRIHPPVQEQSGYTLVFCPSTDWSLGGPIIEREGISLYRSGNWLAEYVITGAIVFAEGDTPLVAAMRCYVESKMGDEIEVPEEMP
jgi:hypothetical protein